MNTVSLALAASLLTAPAPERIRASIEKGIARLEIAATNYTKNRTCFSCHHQAVPMMAFVAAKERGFKIQPDLIKKQREFSLKSFQPKIKEIREGGGIGGGNTMAVYGLYTLQIAGHKRDETTQALVKYLLDRQVLGWRTTANRPPSDASNFTVTGLALECLKKELENVTDDAEAARIRKALERGMTFLSLGPSKNTEDDAFRLRGLVAVGKRGQDFDLARARDTLRYRQRPDGGWSQLDNGESDAYATGSVLVALHKAGLCTSHIAYQRGLNYLCRTQDKSGGWIVKTRSRPVQTYFDNGDPGGKSQFISTAATGWAVLALLQAVDPVK